MKFIVYTVEDVKARTFSEPFVQRSGAVSRTLAQMFSKSPLNPKDFFLYSIGEFDNETGDLDATNLVSIGSVDSLISEVSL